MILVQEKLDVSVKKRSNLFNWRGQFTPEFAEYILSTFTKKGDFILDPFSGSGTVLHEAARLDLKAIGLEINPAAYAMSKFFSFCNISDTDRRDFCNKFEIKLHAGLKSIEGQKVYLNKPDYREAYVHLLKFAQNFNNDLKEKEERILFLNILFQSEKDKGLTLNKSIYKSFLYIKNCLLNLPHTIQPINAELKDARLAANGLTNKIDFIITSPPYINVFNYHQNFRAIIETFNFNILKVANSEIGSNRKNRGNRFRTVIQYAIDMEQSIKEFWKALKVNGEMVLILGRESNVRGTPFFNGQMIIEIIERMQGFSDIRLLERKFINKFGNNIKEDIIIATKSDSLGNNNFGREVAYNHLEKSLQISQKNISDDIRDALKNIDLINPSPLFDTKNILINA